MIEKTLRYTWVTPDGDLPEARWLNKLHKLAFEIMCDQSRTGAESGLAHVWLAIHPKLDTVIGGRSQSQLTFSLGLVKVEQPVQIHPFALSWELSTPPSRQLIDDLVRNTQINALSAEIGPREDQSIGPLYEARKHELIARRSQELIERHNLNRWKTTTDPEPHVINVHEP